MWRYSSVMKLWQNAMTSRSLLPLGSKSEPPLPPPMGRPGQRVLEALLKAQELDYALVYRRVEAQAALVGADGAVELHAEAAVYVIIAVVVDPRHAEGYHALGLDNAFEQGVFFVFRMALHDGGQAGQHFARGLMEFSLAGVAIYDGLHHAIDIVHRRKPPGNENIYKAQGPISGFMRGA